MAFPVSPLLLAVAILVGEASCETDCGFYDLLASLNITDPPPDERPVTDWRNVTTVYLDFTLYAIVKLDMNQQTVISYVWFYMSWQNEFLLWDPDDFCGIESLLIPSDYFWKPDLYISEIVAQCSSISTCPPNLALLGPVHYGNLTPNAATDGSPQHSFESTTPSMDGER
ncbi:unnamed protein product [Ranitomeya imitator]|uniref:Neurotransmitter-gated ion-channel ligand-binding domain-containing protein n=1 Tax=Ranitomeya imitator TaxID=111125 RepID=A0ABN9MI85_9NEOB|nr:unnamed protein product [Ranitomeya imitator]